MVLQVDEGYLLVDVLVLGALAAVAFIALFLFVNYPNRVNRRYRLPEWPGRSLPRDAITQFPGITAGGNTPSVGDSADQLRHVMAANFYKKKVMSKSEYKVFRIVESEIQAQRNGCRVLSQTSLGEIIGSDCEKAFASVNSKRVDILIMGPYGDPIAAIEYQGGGHHQGSAAARDAIKREALRKAGVQFLEIVENHTAEEIGELVRKLFRPRPPARPIVNPWAPA